MTLEQLLQEIDQLNPEQLQQVQKYVEQRRREVSEARADTLMQAFDNLRDGLTSQQLDEIDRSINFKYVEPPRDDLWKD